MARDKLTSKAPEDATTSQVSASRTGDVWLSEATDLDLLPSTISRGCSSTKETGCEDLASHTGNDGDEGQPQETPVTSSVDIDFVSNNEDETSRSSAEEQTTRYDYSSFGIYDLNVIHAVDDLWSAEERINYSFIANRAITKDYVLSSPFFHDLTEYDPDTFEDCSDKDEFSSVLQTTTTSLGKIPVYDARPYFWKDSERQPELKNFDFYNGDKALEAARNSFALFGGEKDEKKDMTSRTNQGSVDPHSPPENEPSFSEQEAVFLEKLLVNKEEELMQLPEDDLKESKAALIWAEQRVLELKIRKMLRIGNPYLEANDFLSPTIKNDFRCPDEQGDDGSKNKKIQRFPFPTFFEHKASSLFDCPYSGDYVSALSRLLKPEQESDDETESPYPKYKCEDCQKGRYCLLQQHCALLPGKFRNKRQPPGKVDTPNSHSSQTQKPFANTAAAVLFPDLNC